jgi:hypothetical protein
MKVLHMRLKDSLPEDTIFTTIDYIKSILTVKIW